MDTPSPDRPAELPQDSRGLIGRRSFLARLATAGVAAAAIPVLSRPGKAALTPSASPLAASDAETVVATAAGRLRGFRRQGVFIFKGVPYGASTAGPGRFLPPQKPQPWSDVRNALQYADLSRA